PAPPSRSFHLRCDTWNRRVWLRRRRGPFLAAHQLSERMRIVDNHPAFSVGLCCSDSVERGKPPQSRGHRTQLDEAEGWLLLKFSIRFGQLCFRMEHSLAFPVGNDLANANQVLEE